MVHRLRAPRAQIGPPIATAAEIRAYMGEVIDENALVRMLKAGELAGAGLDVYEHEPAVNPKLLRLAKAGQSMIVFFLPGSRIEPGYGYTGTVQFSELTVNEATGTVTVRARFPNPQNLLLPGMFVREQIQEGIVRNGILAPQQGTQMVTESGTVGLAQTIDDVQWWPDRVEATMRRPV